jgi:diguanylate cyclase (GGDEF)-like protein
MRLQAKLALALVPLVAAPVLALGWLAWASMGADLRREAIRGMETSLLLAEQGMTDLLSAAKANAALLAMAPETTRYTRSTNAYHRERLFRPQMRQLLEDYRAAFPEYLEIRFLNSDGTEDIRVATPGYERSSRREEADLQALAAGQDALSMRIDPDEDALLLYRRVSVRQAVDSDPDETFEVRGFISVTVSLAWVYSRLAVQPMDFDGNLLLVLPDARVLYDRRKRWDGQQLPSDVRDRLPLLLDPRAPDTIDWEGRSTLIQFRPIGAGIYALVALPRDALMAPLLGLALQVVTVTLLIGLLLATVLFGWLRRLVLRPLQQLRDAARAIGEGQLRPEIAVYSRDELGLLASDLREMSARLVEYRDQIEHLAFHDQLTGLPNRHLIREQLLERLGAKRRIEGVLAVIFLDLDNFKQINDNLGHAVGDKLLRTLAARLVKLLEPRGLGIDLHLARLGGDELLLIADELADADAAADLARAVLATAQEPFELGGAEYVVTASVGIALHPRDAGAADELIRCADLAMYRAKSDGRNAFRFFSAELNERASERLRIEKRLRFAVEGGHLEVYYQPIADLRSGRLQGFEALLRWTDPELGPVEPDRFIPIAEDTGLIQDVTRWTLGAVCAQMAAWKADGVATVPIAVNISAAYLQREDLAERLAQLIRRFALRPNDLHMEITETVLVDLTHSNTNRLNDLVRLGVAIHIDDFGTGYASISYLRRFRIDCIKIDRSFVAQMCTREEDRALVTAMVAMAKAMRLSVIAEGIEDPSQLALLRALGCQWGQGHLFGKPATAEGAGRLLLGGCDVLPARNLESPAAKA